MKKHLVLKLLCCSFLFFCGMKSASAQFFCFELEYDAFSFKDVKTSGHYGLGVMGVGETPSKFCIGGDLHCGMNYGLLPMEFAAPMFSAGPVLGYAINDKLLLALPVDLLCVLNYWDDKFHPSWGMTITPSLYVSGTVGIFLGPQLVVPFAKGSDVSYGFRAGLCFRFF